MRQDADCRSSFLQLAYNGSSPNRASHSRIAIMAKGMSKRGKDQKKPKKEVPKTIAAAPSTKNDVKLTSSSAKPK